MHSLTIFLLCLVVVLAWSKSIQNPECEATCLMYCEYGNTIGDNGCPLCECKESPCENGQAPLDGYFCGRGANSTECPSTYQCVIAPNDAYAVCCPNQQQTDENLA